MSSTLIRRGLAVFSKRAALRAAVEVHEAGRDAGEVGRRRMRARGRPSATRPYMRVKLVVNEPWLTRPTDRQMSETERSVVRSIDAARSSRRVSR